MRYRLRVGNHASLGVMLLVFMMSSAGCGKTAPETPRASTPEETAIPARTTLTEAQIEEFAQQFVAYCLDESARTENYEDFFDIKGFMSRVFLNLETDPNFIHGFTTGFGNSLKSELGIFGSIRQTVQLEDSSYQFLRVLDREEGPRALIRFTSDGGLNYHELILDQDDHGSIKIVDFYIYSMGEKLSQTTRRQATPLMAGQNKSLLQRLSSRDQDAAAYSEITVKMREAQHSGDFQQVLRLYETLPSRLQTEKMYLLVRSQACSMLEDEAGLLETIQTLEQNWPNDPCMSLMGIDQYVLLGKYERAWECIEQLDQLVKRDPYLNIMRGNVRFLQENYPEAIRFMELAIEQDPTLAEAYAQRISLSILLDNHDDTLKWLKASAEQEHYDWGTLADQPDFELFRDTPQYKEWLTYLESR